LPTQDRRDQSPAGKSHKSQARHVTIETAAAYFAVDQESLEGGEIREASEMALTRGSFVGYEFDRMVVLFSMVDDQREVPCAVSTTAMDDLEKPERTKTDQREAQFMRLRDRIEERAARKFLAMEFEGTPPGIILRSIDFRN
jgi:hypothetical protein